MARWFSDHYGADGSADSSVADPRIIPSVGVSGGRWRVKRATITVLDTAAADILMMFTLKSSDRLYALYINTDGGFSASNSAEVGLYTYARTHDGAVLDVDLFGAAQDLTSAIDVLTEILTSGALGGEDRGKTLWEQLAVGAGSDTVDPMAKYDFAITLNGEDDATSSTAVLWAIYTSGD